MADLSLLKKKLAAYSTMAAAFMISQKADAQIVYTDIIPDVELSPGGWDPESYVLDLNNDGIFDFKIKDIYEHTTNGSTLWGATSSTTNSVRVSVYNNNRVDADTTNGVPLQLNSGDTLNSLGGWADQGQLYFRQRHNGQIFNSEGLWISNTVGYLGLRLEFNGEYHYGWVRLQLDHTNWGNHLNVFVLDYAYNATPDSSIVVGEINQCTLPTEPLTSTYCVSDSVTLAVVNLAYFDYQWFKDGYVLSGATQSYYTATSDGLYYVRLHDQQLDCYSFSQDLEIWQPFTPPMPIISQSNDTLFADAWGSLQWYLNGDSITGATNYFLVTEQPGSYTIKSTHGTCNTISDQFVLTSNNDISATDQITFYVSHDVIYVNVLDEKWLNATIKVYTSAGQLIKEERVTSSQNTIDMKQCALGIYFVTVEKEEQRYLQPVFILR